MLYFLFIILLYLKLLKYLSFLLVLLIKCSATWRFFNSVIASPMTNIFLQWELLVLTQNLQCCDLKNLYRGSSPSTEQGAVSLVEQPLVPQEVTGQGALAEKQSRAHSFCLCPEGLQALRMCSYPGWFSNEERQFLFLTRLHNLLSQQLT